jgi:hypothetical protein
MRHFHAGLYRKWINETGSGLTEPEAEQQNRKRKMKLHATPKKNQIRPVGVSKVSF